MSKCHPVSSPISTIALEAGVESQVTTVTVQPTRFIRNILKQGKKLGLVRLINFPMYQVAMAVAALCTLSACVVYSDLKWTPVCLFRSFLFYDSLLATGYSWVTHTTRTSQTANWGLTSDRYMQNPICSFCLGESLRTEWSGQDSSSQSAMLFCYTLHFSMTISESFSHPVHFIKQTMPYCGEMEYFHLCYCRVHRDQY